MRSLSRAIVGASRGSPITLIRPPVSLGVRMYFDHSLSAANQAPKAGFEIPIIDFSLFLKGSESDKNACAKQVLDGFTSAGFVYLGHTGITPKTVSNVFDWSKRFFDLPMEEKLKLAWDTPESNRGYVVPGREKVSNLLDEKEIDEIRAVNPDLKESMEIGKEPSDNYQVFLFKIGALTKNKWPEILPRFRFEMMEFYNVCIPLNIYILLENCHKFHLEILSAIAIGLGLSPRYFDNFCDKRDHNLRLLHYPAVPKSTFDDKNQVRAGAHTGICYSGLL